MTAAISERTASTYPPGVELFTQGQILEEIFFVVGGTIKLAQTDARGKESLIGFATSLDWLGSAAAMANQVTPVSAVTCSEAVLRRFSLDTFRRLLREDEEVSAIVHEAHAKEICRHINWIGRLNSSDSRARLASVLSRFALTQVEVRRQRPIRMQLPIRQWELAEFIGVAPEHLSRLLRDMEVDGLIRRDKGWIVIADLDRLED